jgi:hypothetical protein
MYSIFTEPDFIGALIGSFATGATAVGILLYENNTRRREYYFRSYGTMHALIARLVPMFEVRNLVQNVKELHDKVPGRNSELVVSLQDNKNIIKNLYSFLEKERDNIPYEFASRYHALVNHLDYVLLGYERASSSIDEKKIKHILVQLDHCNKSIEAFIKNGTLYLKSIEEKYKLKDFY